ncbi:MAG: UDP-3-O-(3-hydroxymyristoyl)glucosamine N-acyltransferase [Planctomycetota bacterium]
MSAKSLGELAEYVGGYVQGDPSILIEAASTLGRAENGQISFLANDRYARQLQSTRASAVIVAQKTETPVPLLIAKDPYYAFMQIVVLLHGHRQHPETGISQKASISDNAKVGGDCHIHDFVTISSGAIIGSGCIIYPGVFIGPNVQIGYDCIIYPNVAIYDGTKIGNRVIINANTTIGQDGFGFATHDGVHHKIPQIGTVVLEDDVELGAGCAVERGTLGDTVIGKGSKIGDLVAIGHATKIGPHCLLVAQVGIAGSTNLGSHCILGGQVGVVGHINIGNNVTIGAQAGVIKSVPDGQIILGAPAIEATQGKRAYSTIQYLPEMRQSIKQLEKQMEKLLASEENERAIEKEQ